MLTALKGHREVKKNDWEKFSQNAFKAGWVFDSALLRLKAHKSTNLVFWLTSKNFTTHVEMGNDHEGDQSVDLQTLSLRGRIPGPM